MILFAFRGPFEVKNLENAEWKDLIDTLKTSLPSGNLKMRHPR